MGKHSLRSLILCIDLIIPSIILKISLNDYKNMRLYKVMYPSHSSKKKCAASEQTSRVLVHTKVALIDVTQNINRNFIITQSRLCISDPFQVAF